MNRWTDVTFGLVVYGRDAVLDVRETGRKPGAAELMFE